MKESKWIKDKDRCWICKRTRQEVIDDSFPDGEMFNIEGSKEDLINSAFVDYDIACLCYKFPICKICNHFISMIANELDQQEYNKDEISDYAIDKMIKRLKGKK